MYLQNSHEPKDSYIDVSQNYELQTALRLGYMFLEVFFTAPHGTTSVSYTHLLVPPGITGVWQVSGRSDTTYEERVLMDSWYVHNWSVWIDIVYLLKTVLVVCKAKGAY